MKKIIATAAVAAALSGSFAATASAAPAAMSENGRPATVQLVDHRGHGWHEHYSRDHRRGHDYFDHDRREPLTPREIVRRLRHQGYHDIGHLKLRRGNYIVEARGYRGQVRLVVDGHTGRVIERHLVRSYRTPGWSLGSRGGRIIYGFSFR